MKRTLCFLTACVLCVVLLVGTLALVACNKQDAPPEPIVEPEIEVSGAYTLTDGTFVATEDNAFGYITNRSVSEGSAEFVMTSTADSCAGLVFALSDDMASYYFLGVNNLAPRQFVLMKHENGEDVLLKASYMSQHKHSYVYELRVELFGSKIMCFNDGQLYLTYTDENRLEGTKIGFKSGLKDTSFADFELSKESKFVTHDVILAGHSYFHLWTNCAEDLDKFDDVFNIGIGGTITSDWIDHVDEIVEYNPSKVIFCIGINDFPGVGANVFNNLKTAIDRLLERLPNVEICALSINQTLTHNQWWQQISVFDCMLRDYANATERVYYGDMDNAFLNDQGYPDPNCFTDGLHPTAEAYKVFADAIYKAFGIE